MLKTQRKIPLLTYYSPSHEELFKEYFYPSYSNYLSESFELQISKGDQLCESIFRTGNWNQQVKEKIVFVNEFMNSTSAKFFLFSDVDIIFYKNIIDDLLKEIKNYDLVLQNDSVKGRPVTLCSGFYFCRINKRTKMFFKNLVRYFDDRFDDQQNINAMLSYDDSVRYKALSKKFYNFSHAPLNFWTPGAEVPFPNFSIVMYHANFTIGVANKLYLLKTFKQWGNKLRNTN